MKVNLIYIHVLDLASRIPTQPNNHLAPQISGSPLHEYPYEQLRIKVYLPNIIILET